MKGAAPSLAGFGGDGFHHSIQSTPDDKKYKKSVVQDSY